MKRGEPAIYRPIEPPGRPGGYYQAPPNYDFRGMYNQRLVSKFSPARNNQRKLNSSMVVNIA